jgi:hypothetical protein
LPRTSSDFTGDLVAPRNVSRIFFRKASTSIELSPRLLQLAFENVVESAHSAHATRRASLTSGPAGLPVDSIAASLKPAASRNAATCALS